MRRHVIIVFTLFCARAGWPCSFPDANFDGPSAPRDAREGVPQNARLLVDIDSPFELPVATGVTLTSEDGTVMTPPFATEGAVFFVRPSLLDAETTYTFEIRAEQLGESLVSTRTFTTTTGEDTMAPAIHGELEQPTYSYISRSLFEFSTCGPGEDAWYVDLTYPDVSDDMGLGGAHIFTVDQSGGRTLRKTDLDGLLSAPSIRFTEPGTYTFQIDVFDLAGNTTSSNEVTTVLLAAIVSCSAVHETTTKAPLGALALLVTVMVPARRRAT